MVNAERKKTLGQRDSWDKTMVDRSTEDRRFREIWNALTALFAMIYVGCKTVSYFFQKNVVQAAKTSVTSIEIVSCMSHAEAGTEWDRIC